MKMLEAVGSVAVLSLLAACSAEVTTNDPAPPPAAPAVPAREAPELGVGDHSASSVTLNPIAVKLTEPTALAFNPDAPNELWIAMRESSAIAVYDVSADPKKLDVFEDDSAHFLDKPIGIAFSDNGTFATCQASRDERGGTKGDDHMGPTVFPASRDKLRASVSGAHLDMVHHTPLCAGIVSAGGSVYYILNGLTGSLDKYDFGKFHPPGGEDHADSKTWRFLTGAFKRNGDVPSQMVYDAASKTIYVADGGNGRVVKIDVSATGEGKVLTKGNMMDGPLLEGTGAVATDIVPAGSDLKAPSGLALRNGLLYVTDSATGIVAAFKPDGTRVNYLETGLPPGALSGVAFGEDGKVYVADRLGNQVLRVEP